MATTNLRDTYGTIDMELKKYKLGELADFYGGVAYKPSDITNEGIRIIRGGNIQNGVILEKADDVFLPLSYANPENQIHIYDTIIVSSTGSIDALAKAATCFEEMPGTQIGAFLRIIRPKDKKNAMLISAWCTSQHFRDYMINCAKGTSINNIRTDFLENYELVVPSDENVRGLSSLYLNIERKLYLNRHINQNLEALAKQLYDYWFVQFDFPDENGKPYKSSGGKMVWNERLKREIPQGWEVKIFADILGKVDSTPRLSTDEYLLSGKYPIIDQTTNVYFAGFTDREDAVLFQYPVVVFGDHSCDVKYVNFPFVRGADGTQIMLSKNDRVLAEYLYFAVKGVKIGKGYARHYSFLKGSLLIIPEQAIANMFKEKVATWFISITNNRMENLSLTKQRDELLPLLMNGQVNFDLSAC